MISEFSDRLFLPLLASLQLLYSKVTWWMNNGGVTLMNTNDNAAKLVPLVVNVQ